MAPSISVCQAASALVEGDSTPSWLQAAKQIGSLYSAASSADSYAPSSSSSQAAAAANPLWFLWSVFSGNSGTDSRSSDLNAAASSNELGYKSSTSSKLNAGSSVANLVGLLNPLMGLFAPSLQRTSDSAAGSMRATSAPKSPRNGSSSSSSFSAQHQSLSSGLKTISNLLLTGLSLAGLYDWLGASTSLFAPTSTTFARRKKPFEPGESFVDTPASLAAMASAAKQLKPGALSGGGGGAGPSTPAKQPPTPCPSVEEYISPTFARNYQGAWKYVVQIPHEGYFTQTIQRSSCMRQKCEFTEGVCHEAPRWVSLLVAEIYYPHAIFGLPNGQANQQAAASSSNQLNQRVSMAPNAGATLDSALLMDQLMATSPSMSSFQQAPFNNQAQNQQHQQQQQPSHQNGRHHQHQAKSVNAQDPLQMTDSLNTYNLNHNNNQLDLGLSSAYLSAANELGLDLTNVAQMQQLANAHNYQLMQRNGLVASQLQQQPQIESRVSHAAPITDNTNTNTNTDANTNANWNNNQDINQAAFLQQQQQYKVAPIQHSQQSFASLAQPLEPASSQQALNSDYIKALAIETLRQNPHLSVDDLIKSLQLQQARKKRDLAGSAADNGAPMRQLMANMSPGQQAAVQYAAAANQQRPPARLSHHVQQHAQARSSSLNQQQSAESLPSINEINSVPDGQQQQQQPPPPPPPPHQKQAHQASLDLAALNSLQSTPGFQANVDGTFTPPPQAPGGQPQLLGSSGATQTEAAGSHAALMSELSAGSAHQHKLANAHLQHHQQQLEAQAKNGNGNNNMVNQAPAQSSNENQMECDGHDKIGCYVVRVYYDWFLVNGSCKCWKTNAMNQQHQQQQQTQQHQQTGSTSSAGSGSFIRRIFTG